MGLFNRKPPEKDKPPTDPIIYIEHQEGAFYTTSRFFFTEVLDESSTERIPTENGGVILRTPILTPEVREFQRKVIKDLPGLMKRGGTPIRLYKYYVAITWLHDDQPHEFLDQKTEAVEQKMVARLTEHFGWHQSPQIHRFRSDAERRETAKRLGVDWTLGHHD